MNAPRNDRPYPAPAALLSGRLLVIFGPVLALGASTVLLALVAGLFGWFPHEMYLVAMAVGAPVMLLATVLFFRQTRERRDSEAALLNVESRIGEVVNSAMDAIVSTDASQRIVLYNAAAERMFHWSRESILGQPLDKLIPQRFHSMHRKHVENFRREGTISRRMQRQSVLAGVRANGEEFPIEASISKHSENGGTVFTVIVRDVTERARADEALRKSQEELRELGAAAHSIREQEQRRVARELHDELGQALTALKMDVAWLGAQLREGEDAVARKLGAMQAMLDGTVAATRRISADLRPLMLDDLGLIPAAEWLVQNFSERSGIRCELEIGAPDLELQDPQASALYRILQESLTNVARHAKASQVEVRLDRTGGAVTLRVRDDGRGFSVNEARKGKSYGLLGLRERTYLLGGEVRIDSEPGKGTTIEVSVPLGEGGRPS
jgi:PAS domain S-box-containing protein